jgi:SM-20-related protein
MEDDFERLIEGLIHHEIGITPQFIGKELARHLRCNLLALHEKNLMPIAGIGNTDALVQNQKVRNDRIYWIDYHHQDPYENEFLDRMDNFIRYLNLHCYAGIQTCEFHYALYEPGSFYKRHRDQFRNDPNRLFSLITYLNEDWEDGDGGELVIYQAQEALKIAPTLGKTVFFRSNELEHEVLETHKPRLSITGWLKR